MISLSLFGFLVGMILGGFCCLLGVVLGRECSYKDEVESYSLGYSMGRGHKKDIEEFIERKNEIETQVQSKADSK